MTRSEIAPLLAEMQRMQRRLDALEAGAKTGQLNNASLTGTTITVYAEDGETPMQQIGLHSDGTVGQTAMNGPVPPKPSTPKLTPGQLSLTAAWDGTFLDADGDAAPRPTDLRHVEVHVSTSSGFVPDAATLQGTLAEAGSLVVQPLEVVAQYVRLVSVSTSSVSSDPSSEATATPEEVVASDILDGIVTTLKLADDAVTNAKIAGSAVDANKLADGSVSAAKVVEGAIGTSQLALGAVNTDRLSSDVATSISDASASAASAMTAAQAAQTAADAAQATADGAIRTYYQADPPTGLNNTDDLGDLWFDTDTNQAYRWNGTDWVLIQDNSIAEALAAAQNAQTTADGKIVSYYQGTAPAGAATGDLWYDTAHDNRVSWWDGSAWQPVQVGTQAIQANAIVADLIAAGAIGADELAANSIVAGKIAAGVVDATALAAQSVTTAKLDALAVTADKIAANAVTAGKIEAGAVTAGKLESSLAILGEIRSPNYVAQTSGWTVRSDGTAEFNEIGIRGSGIVTDLLVGGDLFVDGAATVVGDFQATGFTEFEDVQVDGNLTIGTDVVNTAWTPFTPTWTSNGTAPSYGNADVSAAYKKIGKTVSFRIHIGFGTTTNFGTGQYSFSLPVAPAMQTTAAAICADGTTRYAATAWLTTGSGIFRIIPGNAGNAGMSNATPFTWGSGDELIIGGTYEAA